MKRDLAIAITVIVIISAACYALAVMRPDLKPTLSHPFSLMNDSAAGAKTNETVIMRVNGEPITDREFAIFTSNLPQQAQMYLENPQGRKLLAEQYVRMKVLEQEGRRLGADGDPDVAAKMKFGKTNVDVEYAMRKISEHPNERILRDEYEKNKADFDSVDLSHIVVGYQGSSIPSRRNPVPTREQAMMIAKQMVDKIRAGEQFEKLAALSDDTQSSPSGGRLGMVPLAQLPPEMQGPIAKLATGQVSQPVVTQFGVHLFRVNARHTQPFEEVKQALQQRAAQTIVKGEVDRLQKSAKVEFDPKFFPPAPARGKTPPS